MKKLKSCPFCGSRAFMYQKKIKNGWLAEIACWHKYDDSFDECAIKPSVSTVQKTEKEAHEVVKKAWNRRVSEAEEKQT